ncbi:MULTISPECIES: GNAT family N-acetyltransferase [Streptomyces]|uniref:GNAT family N-acetyltransferase n=1 Tax=Streptomyces TaxID=1883 RepID=UPI0029BABD2E|nr:MULTISPECIES: GNAT family N-acetyltransferase [Streptomyces]MDX3184552.1 GNAT family N-acetyltransferase [Streptomyces sp. ME02-7008A-1]MDX3305097.1 GNAT family N-acetyltransferase [Streptomyces sp. ME02-7008A]WSI20601.1 GNAT family N-acetyltransferase [[Kitasatospora] papulosa]
MTTTIRPAGPVQQGADGARARTYDVCDNGRPVGAVGISTDPAFGPSAGILRSLGIDEAHRRRGRGTIAALAAEEVLRGWGCTQVRLVAPADNGAARSLAAVLGYTERSRNMLKTLRRTAPALPPGVTGRRMTQREFDAWAAVSVGTYARSWMERGVPQEQARRKSETDHAANLPDGLATPGMYFHVLVHDGAVVGHVWVARREEPEGQDLGYVFDVEVRREHRGRGYGRALMHLAEDVTLDAGLGLLGLHVFASNTPALRLYESLGYEVTQYNLAKAL